VEAVELFPGRIGPARLTGGAGPRGLVAWRGGVGGLVARAASRPGGCKERGRQENGKHFFFDLPFFRTPQEVLAGNGAPSSPDPRAGQEQSWGVGMAGKAIRIGSHSRRGVSTIASPGWPSARRR